MNQTDFKSLWQGLPTGPIPPVEEVIAEAKSVLQKTKRKIFVTNITLALTVVFIVWLFFQLNIKMITTKLGILCIVIAIVTYLMVYNRMLLDLFKTIPDTDSKAYLDKLIDTNKKQQFLQHKMLTGYFVLLSLGIALYMIEYALKMSLWMAIAAYAVTAAWVALNWFVIRPKTIRKQQAALDSVIGKLQEIKNAE